MKKNLVPFLLGLAVALLLSLTIHSSFQSPNAEQQKSKESVFERVMRTRTIKCGYFVWAPFISKDVNTGELSGIYIDYMNAFSKVTGLEIEWVQELNFDIP